MHQPGAVKEREGRVSSDDELVAAFAAGLTIEEVVALYRASIDDVRQLLTGVSRPKPRCLLGLVR
jgi:hypothetical protein